MAWQSVLSSAKRLLGPAIREAQLYPAIIRAGSRPRVAFLTHGARSQSGLLRVQNIADGLAHHGWASIIPAPSLSLRQRNRVLRHFRPDVVVLQKCRHPLNRVEYLKEWPLVLDLDDADFMEPTTAPVLEDIATHAKAVMARSRFVRDWAARFNPNATVVWTGTPLSMSPRPDHRLRAPIITWAQADPLGYPAELEFCRDVMVQVVSRIGPVDLRLYRCVGQEDHPVLKQMASAGVRLHILPYMSYDQFLASLQEVAVGLSPLSGRDFSRGKSFGKILGYIDAHVPVICSDDADHELFFTPESGIVSNDRAVWVDAICRLIADPDARNRMAKAAHEAAVARLSTEAIVSQVHGILSQVRASVQGASLAGQSRQTSGEAG